jgi:hypothetical protein
VTGSGISVPWYVNLSASGGLTVTPGFALDQAVLVQAVDGSGKSVVGSLQLRSFYMSLSASQSVVPGQTSASVLNLNTIPSGIGGSASTRVWSFVEGQSIPAWLTLSEGGVLSASPGSATPTGKRDYVVSVLDTSNPNAQLA